MIRRFAPVAILAAGIAAFFALELDQLLSFEALRTHRAQLLDWVEQRGFIAGLAFTAIYAASVTFSLPSGLVLSVAGGFLFGSLWGTVYTVIGATLGATALFLIAKTAFGDFLRSTAGPWLKRMDEGFQKNALSYLLVLRLVPIFPFFIVNLVPAFLGVPFMTYLLGTFFGIIPGTFVFASVGAGLGSVFDSGEELTAAGILTPTILTALVGIAVLALIPVAYKRFKARSATS